MRSHIIMMLHTQVDHFPQQRRMEITIIIFFVIIKYIMYKFSGVRIGATWATSDAPLFSTAPVLFNFNPQRKVIT